MGPVGAVIRRSSERKLAVSDGRTAILTGVAVLNEALYETTRPGGGTNWVKVNALSNLASACFAARPHLAVKEPEQ